MISQLELGHALSIALAHSGAEWKNIFLDFRADSVLRVVGTDGHRMACIDLNMEHDVEPGTKFPLYTDYAAQVVKKLGKTGDAKLFVFGTELMVLIGDDCLSYPAPEDAPEPPDFDRLVNAVDAISPKADRLPMSAGYIADALKALDPICDGTVYLTAQDGKPLRINARIDGRFQQTAQAVVLIMCKRSPTS